MHDPPWMARLIRPLRANAGDASGQRGGRSGARSRTESVAASPAVDPAQRGATDFVRPKPRGRSSTWRLSAEEAEPGARGAGLGHAAADLDEVLLVGIAPAAAA